MTDDELEVFFDVAYDYVREAHKREDIARIRDAIHQTADYAGGNIKRWVKAARHVAKFPLARKPRLQTDIPPGFSAGVEAVQHH